MFVRTFAGLHRGRALLLGRSEGTEVRVTVWEGLLLLKRNLTPEQRRLLRRWNGMVLAGGLWWHELPPTMSRNNLAVQYWPDKWWNRLTWPLRPWLVPGMSPPERLWRLYWGLT